MQKRTIFFTLSVALLCLGVAHLFASKPVSQMTSAEFPEPDMTVSCACHDGAAVVEVKGVGKFTAQFDGSITVRTNPVITLDDGRQQVPLEVKGYATRSFIDGLGDTVLRLDVERELPYSSLSAQTAENVYPAAQTMRLGLLMETAALPGLTLRGTTLAVLTDPKVSTFPETGATYHLQEPVQFVDVNDPDGEILATIHSVETHIISSRIH